MELVYIALEMPNTEGRIPLTFDLGPKCALVQSFKEGEDAHSVAHKLHMLAIEIENEAWKEAKK